MKQATIALVVRHDPSGPGKLKDPDLLGVLSDDREIEVFERALLSRTEDPFAVLEAHRERIAMEESEFGDYVEDLLSQPVLKPEIREHGLQWLKSKIRIEEYQKAEKEAVDVISNYALRIYSQDPEKTDFLLAGPATHVRVKVFCLSSEAPASFAA